MLIVVLLTSKFSELKHPVLLPVQVSPTPPWLISQPLFHFLRCTPNNSIRNQIDLNREYMSFCSRCCDFPLSDMSQPLSCLIAQHLLHLLRWIPCNFSAIWLVSIWNICFLSPKGEFLKELYEGSLWFECLSFTLSYYNLKVISLKDLSHLLWRAGGWAYFLMSLNFI